MKTIQGINQNRLHMSRLQDWIWSQNWPIMSQVYLDINKIYVLKWLATIFELTQKFVGTWALNQIYSNLFWTRFVLIEPQCIARIRWCFSLTSHDDDNLAKKYRRRDLCQNTNKHYIPYVLPKLSHFKLGKIIKFR